MANNRKFPRFVNTSPPCSCVNLLFDEGELHTNVIAINNAFVNEINGGSRGITACSEKSRQAPYFPYQREFHSCVIIIGSLGCVRYRSNII